MRKVPKNHKQTKPVLLEKGTVKSIFDCKQSRVQINHFSEDKFKLILIKYYYYLHGFICVLFKSVLPHVVSFVTFVPVIVSICQYVSFQHCKSTTKKKSNRRKIRNSLITKKVRMKLQCKGKYYDTKTPI
jgi:hypothetical protein